MRKIIIIGLVILTLTSIGGGIGLYQHGQQSKQVRLDQTTSAKDRRSQLEAWQAQVKAWNMQKSAATSSGNATSDTSANMTTATPIDTLPNTGVGSIVPLFFGSVVMFSAVHNLFKRRYIV